MNQLEIKQIAPTQVQVDMESVQAVPAFYSNALHVALGGALVRISFGEAGLSPKAVFRTAVAISPQDAKSLAEAILAALDKLEESQKSAQN